MLEAALVLEVVVVLEMFAALVLEAVVEMDSRWWPRWCWRR